MGDIPAHPYLQNPYHLWGIDHLAWVGIASICPKPIPGDAPDWRQNGGGGGEILNMVVSLLVSPLTNPKRHTPHPYKLLRPSGCLGQEGVWQRQRNRGPFCFRLPSQPPFIWAPKKCREVLIQESGPFATSFPHLTTDTSKDKIQGWLFPSFPRSVEKQHWLPMNHSGTRT